MGKVVGHAVGGVDKVIAVEDVEEFGAGHASGVTTDGTEDTQEFGALAVFGRGDFLEIGERPVHLVAVNVVDLEALGARSDEGLPYKMMAETVGELSHLRICRMHVWLPDPACRTKAFFEFTALGTKELAVVGAVKDFAADEFRRDLLDNWYIHKHCPSEGWLVSERQCKGTAIVWFMRSAVLERYRDEGNA